jgi:ribosomal protein S18 acetylase RimI-like enzyme
VNQSSETSILRNESETLLRQVHPTQYPNGCPSKEAFVPSERDKGLLSTLRETVGPEEAYRRWTEDQGRISVGTFGITVAEIQNESLTAIDDAEATSQPDHASVDFTSVSSKGQRRQIGRRLRDAAVARGCLFQP